MFLKIRQFWIAQESQFLHEKEIPFSVFPKRCICSISSREGMFIWCVVCPVGMPALSCCHLVPPAASIYWRSDTVTGLVKTVCGFLAKVLYINVHVDTFISQADYLWSRVESLLTQPIEGQNASSVGTISQLLHCWALGVSVHFSPSVWSPNNMYCSICSERLSAKKSLLFLSCVPV